MTEKTATIEVKGEVGERCSISNNKRTRGLCPIMFFDDYYVTCPGFLNPGCPAKAKE